MSAILTKINNDVIDLEERLLAEFQRLREHESSDTYSSIESSLNEQISLSLSTHLQALEHSGDRDNLSLRTEEHEQLDERMLVVKNLLNRRIPTAFLEVSHQEANQSRRVLEILVIRARTAAGRKTEKSTSSPPGRNRLNIIPEEERKYSGENLYLDNGVFSASRELVILNQQVVQHHEEDQSIEEVIKARSEFKSRELTRGHAEAKKSRNIAQSPDEIRQKLDGQTSDEGTSSFTAKNLSRRALKPPPGVRDKRDIAQSPEAIRKKLEGKTSDEGESSFTAKNLSRRVPPPTARDKRDIAQSPEAIRKKLEGKTSDDGESSFTAKNLSRRAPATARDKRDIAQSPEAIRKKLEGKTSTAGESSFVAKDLSLRATTGLAKKKIAQSPEAIRKKLELRQAKSSDTTKAESVKSFSELTLTDMETAEPKPTGKAQFGPKDASDPKS